MTEQPKLETKDVDLHGVSVTLPADIADKIIQGRDADKAKFREQAEKYGKLEAEKAAAEAARVKADEDKVTLEMAKKGEIDGIKAMLTKDAREREAKLAAKARDKHLAALIGNNEKVAKSAISDIVEQLRGRTRYDFDSETVVVLDPDGLPAKDANGKLVEVDAFANGWLENRPHYLRDGTPKGTGAAGGQSATGKSISQAALLAMSPTEQGKFFLDGGSISQ